LTAGVIAGGRCRGHSINADTVILNGFSKNLPKQPVLLAQEHSLTATCQLLPVSSRTGVSIYIGSFPASENLILSVYFLQRRRW
jgi:hypothetical protein